METRRQRVRGWAAEHTLRSELIARFGVPAMPRPVPASERFAALCRAVVYQQLAGAAAAKIWERVVLSVGSPVVATAVLATPPEKLRAAGLSSAKLTTIVDVAQRVDDGRLRLGRLGAMDEDELTARLVAVKGIGPWTAHMFMMGTLRREDVWPVGDYGVKMGLRSALGWDAVPTAAQMNAIGNEHRPYRSTLARWCWQIVDTNVPEGD